MKSASAKVIASALAMVLSGSPPTSAASEGGWSDEGRPRVTVHNHLFDLVKTTASGCELVFELYFDAPKEGYADERNPVRNYYRFLAKIELKNGETVKTTGFFNRTPGRRMYTYRHDTSAEGCWAKKRNQVIKLDVNVCRNRRCRVEPFE